MSKFVLTCCSTADMTEEYFKKREIPYVCFHYLMDDCLYPDDLGKTMSFDEFYLRVSKGSMPTTSQVNVTEFIEFFEPFLIRGEDILHVTLSSGLSGSYNSACIARDELKEKYPERTIEIVDSLSASAGYGLLVDGIADRRDEGRELEECCQWAAENRQRIQHWFFTTDLSHLKRGGRISATSAMVGTVLNICPLISIDGEGHLVPRSKVRTKKRAIQEVVHKMVELAEHGEKYHEKCCLSYSACKEDAQEVSALIEEKFPALKGKIIMNSIGTVIGAHTGPGTVALFFFGSKREE